MPDHSQNHQFQHLIKIFDEIFYDKYNTRLIKGTDEPIYVPQNEKCSFHQIIFAHGYYSSALHEISHWCIAGEKRRLLEDYGYWYEPDGRNEQQQRSFEQIEIEPQAIEWAFNVAANKQFHVSTDNLNGAAVDSSRFKKNVHLRAQSLVQYGFPERAQMFINGLLNFYQSPSPLTVDQFVLN